MNNNRRFGEIILGVILLLMGLSALEGAPPVALLVAVFGFFLLARQFGMTQQNNFTRSRTDAESDGASQEIRIPRRERRRERDAAREETAAREPRIFDHALDAARSAGIDLENARVYPVDIGFMAFSADQEPTIYRTAAIPDDVDYIQPFLQLRLPMRVTGNIRFEIRDSTGAVLFVHEIQKDLARGDNLITPAARLPIHDLLNFDGAWELTVSANGVPIAKHQVLWKETGSRLIRQHIQADGEISGELKALVEDSRLGRLSLEDLLAAQDEDTEVIESARNQSARGAN